MSIKRIEKRFIPMTETAFYILLALHEPKHGYGIIKDVEEMTNGRMILGSGTVYGTLNKMVKSEMITMYSDEERKKVYEITPIGKELMRLEMERLKELYQNMTRLEERFQENE